MSFFLTKRNICQATFLFLLVAMHFLWGVSTTYAVQLYDDKGYTINLDTTLSWGAKWRLDDRDPDLIHVINGGNKAGANGDNGNLNFDKGLISNAIKATSELEIKKDNFGLFVRGTAFYDYEIMKNDREYVQLGEIGKEQAGKDVELLDAYIWGAHDFGEVPVMLKVGEQVVNWGESVFIRNGINAINPIDAGAIRVPGSEVREALIPEGMVNFSISPTLNTSIEAIYLYDWGETEADASGTYFSNNDWVTPDGFKAVLDQSPFGDMQDASLDDTFMAIGRSATREASDQGQWGASFKAYVPALNDTEFGFFYLRYHSRLPLGSATTGTQAGAQTAGIIAASAPPIGMAVGVALAGGATVPQAIAAGTAAGVAAGAPQESSQAIAATAATGGNVAATTGAYAADSYVETAKYYSEYPEDIQLFGVSFNTEAFGWGVQGEVSHRLDVPYQIDDAQLIAAAMGAINANQANNNLIGNYQGQFETDIQGYLLYDVTQAQVALTKMFRPILGSDGGTFITEFGYTYVHDLPSEAILESPSGIVYDSGSWGYRSRLIFKYLNAIGPVNLFPRIGWNHDVKGSSPTPGRSFLEDRRAVMLGLKATYQSWSFDVSYSNFFGAGKDNKINDRDFIGCSLKYSF
ncbi:MAG: DUF1302 domain-containing protein [Desulfobacula sp.]|uniref:DUF1302 domain-containing protein n=1 Tax=Desulfobacula sp. TaxID=2593537 RepID=UPI0025C187FE|nr:DUF1302 domain-containing protein [Desulfobacula sp.]MCD4719191.1 DUF1302 domain-containing protein [Desulfobacula sp.]